MAQQINPKCLTCSQIPVEKAQHLHGQNGDRCWNPKLCYRRRSHYRHRQNSNAKRRGQRAQAKIEAGVTQASVQTLLVPVQPPPVALIYLYQEARRDAHLHAIAVTVWQGEQKLAETKPIH